MRIPVAARVQPPAVPLQPPQGYERRVRAEVLHPGSAGAFVPGCERLPDLVDRLGPIDLANPTQVLQEAVDPVGACPVGVEDQVAAMAGGDQVGQPLHAWPAERGRRWWVWEAPRSAGQLRRIVIVGPHLVDEERVRVLAAVGTVTVVPAAGLGAQP